jgi:conjugative transfer region protein TrbK
MRALRAISLIIVAAGVIHTAQLSAQQANAPSTAPAPVTDPLAKELERCKALHEQASTDGRCQAAYKESRRRFLTPPPDYQPGKVDMFPKTQQEPWTTETKPAAPSTDK